MISFVTVIKILHHDFSSALNLYIESITSQITCDYEIIVVEDICEKNTSLYQVPDHPCIRYLPYHASYPNPYNYPLIEAYAKNVGIQAAKYPFICVTNCDILFSPEFFPFLMTLEPKTFYRFPQFELSAAPASLAEATTLPSTPLNNLSSSSTLKDIAFKSGDIMLMDAESWSKIKGFPENTIWVHSDLIVCKVAQNNGFALNIPSVRIFTSPHVRATLPSAPALEMSYAYLNACVCNPLFYQSQTTFS